VADDEPTAVVVDAGRIGPDLREPALDALGDRAGRDGRIIDADAKPGGVERDGCGVDRADQKTDERAGARDVGNVDPDHAFSHLADASSIILRAPCFPSARSGNTATVAAVVRAATRFGNFFGRQRISVGKRERLADPFRFDPKGALMAVKKTAATETTAKKTFVRRRRKVTEEMIRERAYFNSMEAYGSPLEHWLAAERELLIGA
jgi:hypothetical protein